MLLLIRLLPATLPLVTAYVALPPPWHAIALLEEATNCILLQRVGGGYRFIHPLVQEYFASLDVEATLEQDTGQMKSPE